MTRPRRPLAVRLRERLSPQENGCLLFNRADDTTGGYGKIYDAESNRQILAHRAAWQLENGPIPADLHVLHRCDTPLCCNVSHLFLGTNDDNIADKVQKGRVNNRARERTHCLKGHEYSEENTVVNKYGHRNCLTCYHEKNRRNNEKAALRRKSKRGTK